MGLFGPKQSPATVYTTISGEEMAEIVRERGFRAGTG
jgi:hypothetical protein